MLSCQQYGPAIDVWSLGCIYAEMLGTKPLFPGTNYIVQLRLILETLGSPADEDMVFIKSARARAFMAKQSGKPRVPFAHIFPSANPVSRTVAVHPIPRGHFAH
jgi:serine/threonine protein kinase